jgi:hypothetical protein
LLALAEAAHGIDSGTWRQDDMGWPDLLVSDAMMMMAADDTIEDKLVSPMNSPR